jgi:hypothetical protein
MLHIRKPRPLLLARLEGDMPYCHHRRMLLYPLHMLARHQVRIPIRQHLQHLEHKRLRIFFEEAIPKLLHYAVRRRINPSLSRVHVEAANDGRSRATTQVKILPVPTLVMFLGVMSWEKYSERAFGFDAEAAAGIDVVVDDDFPEFASGYVVWVIGVDVVRVDEEETPVWSDTAVRYNRHEADSVV